MIVTKGPSVITKRNWKSYDLMCVIYYQNKVMLLKWETIANVNIRQCIAVVRSDQVAYFHYIRATLYGQFWVIVLVEFPFIPLYTYTTFGKQIFFFSTTVLQSIWVVFILYIQYIYITK